MSLKKCIVCLKATVTQHNHDQYSPSWSADFRDDTLLLAIDKLNNSDNGTQVFCSKCQVFLVRLSGLDSKLNTLACKVKQVCEARYSKIQSMRNQGPSIPGTDEGPTDTHPDRSHWGVSSVENNNEFQNAIDEDSENDDDASVNAEEDHEADGLTQAQGTAGRAQSPNSRQLTPKDCGSPAGPSCKIYEDNWLPKKLVMKPSQLVQRLSEREFIYMDKYPFKGTEVGFKCGLCPVVATFCTNGASAPWYYIVRHARRRHRDNDIAVTTSITHPRCIQVAPKRFQYGKYFFEAVNGKYKCGECGILTLKAKPYNDRTNYIRKHIKYQHEKPSRTYVCKDCGKVYNNRSSLSLHKFKKHQNSKDQFPCRDCGDMFSSSVAAISHRLATHRKLYLKKFICTTCGKTFNRKAFLEDHVAFVHNGKKMNECKVCGKKFSSRTGLKIHRHSHTDCSQYSCELCGMTFTRNSLFTRHKKFSCQLRSVEATEARSPTSIYENNWLPKNLVIGTSDLVKRLSEREFVYMDKYPFQGTECGFKCGLCPLIIKFCAYRKSAPWFNIIKHFKKWHAGSHSSGRTARCAQQRCIQVTPNRFQYGKYSFEKLDGMFKCGECGDFKKPAKYYNEATYMLKHIIDRHENASRMHICEYCGVVYKTPARLAIHKMAKHGDPNAKFPCSDCDKVFGNRVSAMNHKYHFHRKTPGKKFACGTCSKYFSREDFLEDHVACVHNGQRMHDCEECGKRFASRKGLKIHRSNHAGKRTDIHDDSWSQSVEENGSSNIQGVPEVPDTFKDNWLPNNFVLKSSQTVKRLSERDFIYKGKYPFHGTEAGFKCGLCSVIVMFSKSRKSNPWFNLISHFKKWHMGNHNAGSARSTQQRCIQVAPNRFQYGNFFIEKVGGMYECGECRASKIPARPYPQLNKYILLHIKYRHENPSKIYVCEICGAVYSHPKSLSNHKVAKHEDPDQQFPCSECAKVFTNRLAARRHGQNVHLKVCRKKFTCEICEKKFNAKSVLEYHVAFLHHGQRKIECEECGKKFSSKVSLSIHRNSHTGRRKYVCEICGMDFTQQYSVTRHKKTAHRT